MVGGVRVRFVARGAGELLQVEQVQQFGVGCQGERENI